MQKFENALYKNMKRLVKKLSDSIANCCFILGLWYNELVFDSHTDLHSVVKPENHKTENQS